MSAANEWYERYKQMSDPASKWPSISVPTLGCSKPLCHDSLQFATCIVPLPLPTFSDGRLPLPTYINDSFKVTDILHCLPTSAEESRPEIKIARQRIVFRRDGGRRLEDELGWEGLYAGAKGQISP